MWFLGRFNPKDIQIVQEENTSISVKEYLMEELHKVENGSAEYLSIDELDKSMEATIWKHET
jgi:hypothetical protein